MAGGGLDRPYPWASSGALFRSRDRAHGRRALRPRARWYAADGAAVPPAQRGARRGDRGHRGHRGRARQRCPLHGGGGTPALGRPLLRGASSSVGRARPGLRLRAGAGCPGGVLRRGRPRRARPAAASTSRACKRTRAAAAPSSALASPARRSARVARSRRSFYFRDLGGPTAALRRGLRAVRAHRPRGHGGAVDVDVTGPGRRGGPPGSSGGRVPLARDMQRTGSVTSACSSS